MGNFKGDLPSQSLDWWNLTCFEPLLYTVESTVSSNDSFRQCTAAYSCKNNNQLTQYLSDTLCANMHKTQSNFPLTIAGLHTGLKMERSGSNNAKQRQTCRKYQSLSPLKTIKCRAVLRLSKSNVSSHCSIYAWKTKGQTDTTGTQWADVTLAITQSTRLWSFSDANVVISSQFTSAQYYDAHSQWRKWGRTHCYRVAPTLTVRAPTVTALFQHLSKQLLRIFAKPSIPLVTTLQTCPSNVFCLHHSIQ